MRNNIMNHLIGINKGSFQNVISIEIVKRNKVCENRLNKRKIDI